jgi:tetratricopeptide (TPR) repeat protein
VRTTIAALVGAALVVVGVGCAKGKAAGQAWTRWGITKPTAGADAEARLTDAHKLLYELKFDEARQAYQELVKRYPQSPEAHLGLSMAYRYAGVRDTALAEAQTALKLDPDATGVLLDYADLVLPIRTGDLAGMSKEERLAEWERCNLKAAASSHPFSAHAHTTLWVSYMAQGRLSDARHQAFELSDKHYYPQPLLDFAHNLLVGLEPNAVLFTNGDNDTYPPWVLQNACDPFRPDITIANLALLNVPAVVKMLKDSLGLPLSLTDKEIAALAPKTGPDGKTVIIPAEQVIGNIIAGAAETHRPVYFAVTVSQNMTAPYADRLVLEGLVNRVAEGKRAAAVDLDRITENLTKKYRLDWPDKLPPWPQNMSPLTKAYAPMATSYAPLYAQLATHYESRGSRAEADDANTLVVAWMKRGGNADAARSYVGAWLERSPDDARAKELKASLERAGTN